MPSTAKFWFIKLNKRFGQPWTSNKKMGSKTKILIETAIILFAQSIGKLVKKKKRIDASFLERAVRHLFSFQEAFFVTETVGQRPTHTASVFRGGEARGRRARRASPPQGGRAVP